MRHLNSKAYSVGNFHETGSLPQRPSLVTTSYHEAGRQAGGRLLKATYLPATGRRRENCFLLPSCILCLSFDSFSEELPRLRLLPFSL